MDTQLVVIVLTLAALEAVLSADNALVMAVMVRHLPPTAQQRALTLVMWGAMLLRLLGVLAASFIIRYWYLRAFGALYLAYLVLAHFLKRGGEGPRARGGSFLGTVVSLNLVNLAFSVDSILAGVALLSPQLRGTPLGFWIVVAGGLIGLIMVRFASSFFLKLLERFPALDGVAYFLIGWIAFKLGVETVEQVSALYDLGWHVFLPGWLFWSGMALIAGVGGLLAVRRPAMSEASGEAGARRVREALDEAAGGPPDG